MPSQTIAPPAGLTVGTWLVDPKAGHVAFAVKTLWGLINVKGTFDRYEGALTVGETATTGELVVHSDSLDTHHTKRDTHLRSADFFDSQSHPRVTFTTTSVAAAPSGLTVTGDLVVGTTRTRLEVPAQVEPAGPDAVTLRAATAVPRERAGLTWNKLGMIRGDARLELELRLVASA